MTIFKMLIDIVNMKKFFLNLVKSNQIWIVVTLFRLL